MIYNLIEVKEKPKGKKERKKKMMNKTMNPKARIKAEQYLNELKGMASLEGLPEWKLDSIASQLAYAAVKLERLQNYEKIYSAAYEYLKPALEGFKASPVISTEMLTQYLDGMKQIDNFIELFKDLYDAANVTTRSREMKNQYCGLLIYNTLIRFTKCVNEKPNIRGAANRWGYNPSIDFTYTHIFENPAHK